MKRSYFTYFLIVGFLVWGPTVANAHDLKIGYVDTSRILKEAPQADMARKELEREFAPRDNKIVSMQSRLRKLSDKQDKDIASMSDSQRMRLEREMIELRRDIKNAKEEFTEDFNLRRNEELTKLQRLIIQTTVAVAKEDGYDIVLSDNVLYAGKRVDITDKILDKLRLDKNEMHSQNKNASSTN